MDIEKTLQLLGLDDKEAKIYLAVLALGESTVLPIAKKAVIQRTYCYDILDSLVGKGFVNFIEKRGRRRFSAIRPKQIKHILSSRMKEFEQILPDLESLYQKAPQRPKLRFFEGREGVAMLYEEVLAEAKEAWFLGSMADWTKYFPDYIDYIKKQAAKGIKIKEMVRAHDKTNLQHTKFWKKGVQQTRLLPKTADFQTDNLLWNNKFVSISYGADLYAVAVESAEIAQTMRAIYEILWVQATKIE